MADPLVYPATTTYGALIIELGNGASPEVFAAPAGLDSKAFNRSSTTSTANVPSSSNPDAAALVVTAITANTKAVTGSGVLAVADVPTWSAWHESGLPKNVRVRLKGIEYFIGLAVLTQFNITGAKGQNADLLQFSISIEQFAQWAQHTGDPT